jgi:MFS family permease
MTRIAVVWFIYRSTGSSLWLGATSFAGQLPILLGIPLSGWLMNRLSSRLLLFVTQCFALLESLALALFALTNRLDPPSIIILAGLRGAISAVQYPARQAILVELCGDDRLKTALAIDSLHVNLARLFGPAAAGILLVHAGEAMCFLIDAITCLFPMILLLSLPYRGSAVLVCRQREMKNPIRDWAKSPIGHKMFVPLCLLTITSLVGITFTVLLPQYVISVLSSDSILLGNLTCISGIGAIVGVIAIITVKRDAGVFDIYFSCILAGVCLVLLGIISDIRVSYLLIFILSFSIAWQVSVTGVLLQKTFPPASRGRAASLQNALFYGSMPFGSLLLGLLAQWAGTTNAFLSAGLCCSFAGLVAIGAEPRMWIRGKAGRAVAPPPAAAGDMTR